LGEKRVCARKIVLITLVVCIIATIGAASSLSVLNTKDSTILNLKSQVNSLNSLNSDLENKISFDNSTMGNLNLQIANLNSQISNLQRQNSLTSDQNSALQSQINNLNTQMSSLNAQLNTLNSRVKTRVFTWISHGINETMAQWLFNMGFTDVCIRHVTYEQFIASKSVLAGYGITLWDLVSPDFFVNDSSVQDFINSIDSVLTYRSHFIVDDCHSMFQNGSRYNESQKANFLAAVAFYPNNVTLCFCEPEMHDWTKYSFSSVNVDLYCTPDQYNSTVVSSIKDNCLSLGIYLWIWNGSGINWETVTQQQITQTYSLAKWYSANRFIVWMGDENDVVEQGMSLSSLYNYPEWHSFIANCNWNFRRN
jgi:uncharacterized coiled-coil protein SlyX